MSLVMVNRLVVMSGCALFCKGEVVVAGMWNVSHGTLSFLFVFLVKFGHVANKLLCVVVCIGIDIYIKSKWGGSRDGDVGECGGDKNMGLFSLVVIRLFRRFISFFLVCIL